jgi:hypothetical protein
MKSVIVEAFFPEAKGKADFTSKGTGSTWPMAVYKALKVLSSTKGIKKKHITSAKFIVSISDVPKPEIVEENL